MVVVVALSLLAACQTHSLYRNPTSTAKQAVPTASATRVSSAIRLRPPDFTLVSQAGDQKGIQGTYYWQLKSGLAAGYNASAFNLSQMTQLTVNQHETLTIKLSNGPYPDTLDMKVYPQAGNDVNAPVPGGTVKAFQQKTDPLQTHSFSNTPYQWTANVAPGGYFIFLSGHWTNPFTPPAGLATPITVKPMVGEIAFWIQVK